MFTMRSLFAVGLCLVIAGCGESGTVADSAVDQAVDASSDVGQVDMANAEDAEPDVTVEEDAEADSAPIGVDASLACSADQHGGELTCTQSLVCTRLCLNSCTDLSTIGKCVGACATEGGALVCDGSKDALTAVGACIIKQENAVACLATCQGGATPACQECLLAQCASETGTCALSGC